MTNAPSESALTAGRRVVVALLAVGVVVTADRVHDAGPNVDERAVVCELEPPRDIAGLEECLERSPRDVEAMLDLAARYESMGRMERAMPLLRRAVDVDPLDADARLRLAAALFAVGDAGDARIEGARAVALRPGDPAAARLASRNRFEGTP